MFLIDDILLAPLNGLVALAKVIDRQLNEELYSPDKIQEELMQLQLQFELDEISEAEYTAREADLLARLDESRDRGQ
jgi:hypothetical protein